jgi:hypothetical protein
MTCTHLVKAGQNDVQQRLRARPKDRVAPKLAGSGQFDASRAVLMYRCVCGPSFSPNRTLLDVGHPVRQFSGFTGTPI